MFVESIEAEICGQHFALLKEKVLYWKERKYLLLADVHAGKASHFRNNGIPLSTDYLLNDLNKIDALINHLNPLKIIILGDLFHSNRNIENQLVESWINGLSVDVELIIGNHDVHSIHQSTIASKMPYELDSIWLSHEPADTELFNICGHLHPAYAISGKARQHIRVPSFYKGPNFLDLPSFGSLTGKKVYKNLVQVSEVVIVTEEGLLAV